MVYLTRYVMTYLEVFGVLDEVCYDLHDVFGVHNEVCYDLQ